MSFQRCYALELLASEVAEELVVGALRELILPLKSVFTAGRGWIRMSVAELRAAEVLVAVLALNIAAYKSGNELQVVLPHFQDLRVLDDATHESPELVATDVLRSRTFELRCHSIN